MWVLDPMFKPRLYRTNRSKFSWKIFVTTYFPDVNKSLMFNCDENIPISHKQSTAGPDHSFLMQYSRDANISKFGHIHF